MKTKTFLLMLVSLFFVSNFTAQNLQLKFDVVNATGLDLKGVFVSETASENWGNDIIPGDIFTNGATVEVTIPVTENTKCLHDIMITDATDEGRVFPEIDFCEVSKLTFFAGSDGEVYYRTE